MWWLWKKNYENVEEEIWCKKKSVSREISLKINNNNKIDSPNGKKIIFMGRKHKELIIFLSYFTVQLIKSVNVYHV